MTAKLRPAALAPRALTLPTPALAVAALVSLLAGCQAPVVAPSASPSAEGCTLSADPIDGGPLHLLRGAGFPPDSPAVLRYEQAGQPVERDQTSNPALRSDIRGVVLFELEAGREDIGARPISLSAGGCTATITTEIDAAMFPPACPTDAPVASGGPAIEAYEDRVLADEPISYWRFEEEVGPLAAATVGATAAIVGEVVMAQAGPITGSRAIALLGGAARIDLVDLELAGDFTVEAWILFCDDPIDAGDALFGPLPNLNFHESTARLYDGEEDVAIAATAMTHARWYHLALVRAGSEVNLYLDGEPAGGGTFEAPLPIGALGDADQSTLTGLLDEVAIYDRALPAEALLARVAARS